MSVEARYDHVCTLDSVCTVNVTIPKQMAAPVYFYYVLTDYYQNHRRYVSSRSDQQLRGQEVDFSRLDACIPKRSYPPDLTSGNASVVLNPCGLIAASMFNGTYILHHSSVC